MMNTLTESQEESKSIDDLPELEQIGSRVPLSVKREENQDNTMMNKLRKKVCRKIFSIFKEDYKLPIADAKEITLNLEERVNIIYPQYSSMKHYIYTIKNLFKKLKVLCV